jgi:hypothetical protein
MTESLGSKTVPSDAARTKLTPLLAVEAFPEPQRDAARAVAVSITAQREKPSEFYAEVEPREGGQVLVFHLWHKSAFEQQNRHVLGNPGGQCRDVYYDPARQEVTKTLFWQ